MIAGQTLGVYRILDKLGEGGMGQVWRATDTTLGRQVAIKILPDAFAGDPERLARFEREAKTLATLNHPNIAAIYGFEKSAGLQALVMELVEGEDLSERIARGAMPLDEALPIARPIADALEAAHEQGIIHRDLKPANIKVRADGTVKVLDFGLAKALAPDPSSATAGVLSASPTITSPAMTQAGMILGTAAYMSPEQARGRPVDKRADIWAFGCVLYEMVTGRRLFGGDDVAETIASVVKDHPDLAAAPPAVRRLLGRCLEKDPKQRLRDISVAWELVDGPSIATGPEPSRLRRRWLPWAVASAALTAAAAFAALWLGVPVPEVGSAEFDVGPPDETRFYVRLTAAAVSPDGRYLVFRAGSIGTVSSLWLRPIASRSARRLEGTEGANFPFWSPDARRLAFYQDGYLKHIDIAGGTPQVVCDAAVVPGAGGTWSRDGTVLFASTGGLFRVGASGAVPQQVTTADTAGQESGHGHPVFLPDGRRFLYVISSADEGVRGIYAGSLDEPAAGVRVVAADHKASYVASRDGRAGYLLWLRERTLLAQRFDPATLRLDGDPVPVVEDVVVSSLSTAAAFWTSETGVLAYLVGATRRMGSLVWMSRSGQRLGEASPEAERSSFRLSGDGSRIAMGITDDGTNADIWTLDLARQVTTKVTFDPAAEALAAWSPDGGQLAYDSNRSGIRQIYRTASGGGGEEEQLTTGPNRKNALDWSPDGRYLLYQQISPTTGPDLWVLPLEGDRGPAVVLQTPFAEGAATFSPDGKWIAYQSNASGRSEVYVRPFPPGPGSPWQVSNQGGSRPKWGGDGKALYFLGVPAGQLTPVLTAAVRALDQRFEADAPRELFRMESVDSALLSPYDVTPDGQRFLVFQQSEATTPLTVVTDWRAGSRR